MEKIIKQHKQQPVSFINLRDDTALHSRIIAFLNRMAVAKNQSPAKCIGELIDRRPAALDKEIREALKEG